MDDRRDVEMQEQDWEEVDKWAKEFGHLAQEEDLE
jgi:hypothetical protein